MLMFLFNTDTQLKKAMADGTTERMIGSSVVFPFSENIFDFKKRD